MRLRPTRRCVLLHAAGIPVALLPALIDSGLWPLWAGYLALSLLITLADTLLALPRRWIRLEISTPALLYIGAGEAARIGLRVPPRTRSTPAELLLDLDDELEAQPPIRLVLSGEAEAAALVPLVPRRRGSVRVRALWLRWRGPLGLTERILRQGIDRDIDVVPNVRAVRSAALRFFSNREFLSGLKTERYIGDGSEFDSLREFQPGLDHRSIDWKASARHTKLLSRE
ncbi:MAG: DUF58 domain-containing protein, partial [Planctomycetota bacterium]